ncbi:sodium-dependent bicarbonate transport family permease [Curvibacter sp. HBC28]|uniref:Sodium-dependent bicarbonate transport family permease n=1 Tax=Curvibacter microcysteis TaxID=3026419 RepID=A0ABT5MFK5_9BURK|nr:sodium-dependent bicarbonate transport family permease [Curvibacter sp. HBC28]MDD0815347.1 sodium-dependent bicarbonate transport family permease [Curvibacter sp. HBC28]
MQNLLDPAILFFVLGLSAGALRSNLEIPPAIAKFLSLYLLMALGLKGGLALAHSDISGTVVLGLLAALTMAFLVPALGYQVLKRRVSPLDAVAIAASYGSVSAVTFVTASQYLDAHGMAPGGHMAVALVIMESPAVLMAVLLANRLRHAAKGAVAYSSTGGGAAVATLGGGAGGGNGPSLGRILHESFTDGAQLMLLGAMAVGYLSGDRGHELMAPFSSDLFKGMLAFFLLDMGLMVGKNMGSVRGQSPVLLAYACLGPVVHASLALALSALLGLPAGDAALLMVLSASASYIVVPAVLRYAIPEANPSLYFGLSLGVTFPLNLLLGIPVYAWVAQQVLG